MKFFEKISPKVKTIIFAVVIVGFCLLSNIFSDKEQKEQDSTNQTTAASEQEEFNFWEEINIGTSNIVVFCGLAIALGVVKYKKTKIPNRDEGRKEKVE